MSLERRQKRRRRRIKHDRPVGSSLAEVVNGILEPLCQTHIRSPALPEANSGAIPAVNIRELRLQHGKGLLGTKEDHTDVVAGVDEEIGVVCEDGFDHFGVESAGFDDGVVRGDADQEEVGFAALDGAGVEEEFVDVGVVDIGGVVHGAGGMADAGDGQEVADVDGHDCGQEDQGEEEVDHDD